jgi:hypothetical protein
MTPCPGVPPLAACRIVYERLAPDPTLCQKKPSGAPARSPGVGESLASPAPCSDDGQMITVASFPPNLEAWKENEHPYYLEVFGEAEPVLDKAHGQVIPEAASEAAEVGAPAVYEYWWTIGHAGMRPEHRHLFEGRKRLDLWRRLDKIAARIYLYFPISGGWRIQELAASAKYLRPVQNQAEWTQKAAAEWQRMQPILAGAGQAAGSMAVIPGVGVAAASVAPVLTAVSKLQLGAVPQDVKGFGWYVEKVTVPAAHSHGVMQGVMWAIPKEMFEMLGGRLTGSLAVTFFPTGAPGQQSPEVRSLPLLAHAAVYSDSGATWVPAQNRFIEMPLTPRQSSSPAAGAGENQPMPAASS